MQAQVHSRSSVLSPLATRPLAPGSRTLGSVTERIELEVGDRVVKLSNPDRVYFSARGETKLDLAEYYLAVADGIVNAHYHRPCMLHRFPGFCGRSSLVMYGGDVMLNR